MTQPVDVFISSTCYDLVDLRAELRQHLESTGFTTRLSDDYDSEFAVPGTESSVRTCLLNVQDSDVVVCVVDRRYGPPLPFGEFVGKSATHAEVIHAMKPEFRKPIFFFIRDRAFADFEQMRSNLAYSPR